MIRRPWSSCVGALILVTACASRSGAGASTAVTDNSVINAADLRVATQSNLYDYILVHRPMWLSRSRPTTFLADRTYELAVYLDEIRMGGAEVLRQFPPSAATMVRYFDPSSAQGRFGVGNLAGVIQIITRGPR